MKSKMKLLIAYDGSPGADAALDDLRHAGLPRRAQVEVLVVSVADVFVPSSGGLDGAPVADLGSFAYSPREAGVVALCQRVRDSASRAVDELQVVADRGRE